MIKTTKIKALRPSLREKKRYIAFKIQSAEIVSFSSVSNAVYASYSKLFGEVGLAKAGIIVLKERWNSEKQVGILKVSHKYINEVKSSLTLIKQIDNTKVIASSITASGVLKKAVQRAIAA
jgi:ribonuclease P/MRP protein subunit POP5